MNGRRGAGGEQAGSVRIIGGTHRRRLIRFPDRESLRPTPDRVRETLFNWLGQDLTGRECLDLFAGSGALGFEAASRGARRVVMVERDATALRSLRDNVATLGLTRVEVLAHDALEFLRQQPRARFDVIFADPPFVNGDPAGLLDRVWPHLAPAARVYVEAPVAIEPVDDWTLLRSTRAGRVHAHLFTPAEPSTTTGPPQA